MNEELMERLVNAVEKHNEIQEEIRYEMKLQNDLIAVGIEKHKEISATGLLEDLEECRYAFLRRK